MGYDMNCNAVNFNTSHVSINPCTLFDRDRQLHFNTSHVSINPGEHDWGAVVAIISIHLMFLLISGADTVTKKLG